jgi:hypothetical protein
MGGQPNYASGVIDVSAYAGIQFDIAGNPGPLGVLTLALQSANQEASSADPNRPNCGTCNSDGGLCNVAATTNVSGLTSAPQTIRIAWRDLTNTVGPGLDPTRVNSISWFFPWTPGATPYPVDITLGNLQFIEAGGIDGGGD